MLTIAFVMVAKVLLAAVPDGYYAKVDGEKYTALKSALCSIISNHKVLGYSSLWEYYPATYTVTGTTNQVLDMYSDTKRYYGNSGSAVSGMNKEHTVPQSWWGRGTGPAQGNDLFNVIPSDSEANGRKSNYSLGIVSNVSWTNGVTTVGKGTVNGHSSTFFEPADKYKGDFARIYFYMATCYPDLDWTTEFCCMDKSSALTLQSWIIPMLIQWSKNDPVDADEVLRNENVMLVQGNRNPFIDYPELVDYIWGTKTSEQFLLSQHTPNAGNGTAVVKANAPVFSVAGGTEAAPKPVAKGTVIKIKGGSSSATLYVRINGEKWVEYEATEGYNATTQTQYWTPAETTVTVTDKVRIEAYCTTEDHEPSETLDYYYQGMEYSNDYLLYEGFESVSAGKNDSSSGSNTPWEGNIEFPTVSTAYQAGNAVRLGTKSNTGSLTSREMTFGGGTVKVTIGVKGWTNVEGGLIVTLTGAPSQSVTYTATMDENFEELNLTFDGVSANPKITIETSSKRCFINKVAVSAASASGVEEVKSEELRVKSSGCYDLMGRRVNANYRGIVIINGRKIVK